MRITNSMLQRATLSQIQSNMQGIAEAQQKVSTGKRLLKASDDPTATSASMRTRTSLRSMERFERSVDLARSRGTAEEDILLQVTELISRAKVVAVSQSSVTATEQTRSHAKAEVDQLFRQLVDFGNTRFEGTFLFGGVNGDSPPITLDPLVPPDTVLSATIAPSNGEHTVEIAEQRYLPVNHSAKAVFEDTEVLEAVKMLAAGLAEPVGDDAIAGINAALAKLDEAFGNVQNHIGEIGARLNQLDLTRSSIAAVEVGLLQFKSSLEEVDFEEAATELVSRQTALQAAMVATSKVMGLSLADYLR